ADLREPRADARRRRRGFGRRYSRRRHRRCPPQRSVQRSRSRSSYRAIRFRTAEFLLCEVIVPMRTRGSGGARLWSEPIAAVASLAVHLSVADSAAVVADLRRARRKQRVAAIHWVDALYQVYVTGLVAVVAIVVLSSAIGDGEVS